MARPPPAAHAYSAPALLSKRVYLNNVAQSVPAPAGPDATLLRHLVDSVLDESRHLMERMIEATRQALQSREDQSRTAGERHAMIEARQQLGRLAFVMAERYPGTLRKALEKEGAEKQKSTRSLFTVHFDDLELMDESQISESVERARAGQVVASAVEAPLADLDSLVCAAQGLASVRPEHNPLRPDVFLQALQGVVAQMQATEQVRRDWMWHMAQALGDELRKLYLELIECLRQRGVSPVGYAVRQANGQYVYLGANGAGEAPGFGPETAPARLETPSTASHAPATPSAEPTATPSGGGDESLLTLDRLRRLLLGELTEAPPPESLEAFAARFSREFEEGDAHAPPPATDFDITVPAAFEALQEMDQVGNMMERLGNQRAQEAGSASPGHTIRHGGAGGLGQALSMEVVALMVDNMARDSRLLWPVQQIVRALEPALLQLALADPRFFSDKEHPARRLLQEITDRSLAFDHIEAPGFESFMQPLIDIATPLASAHVEGKEPFENALQQLQATWAERERERKRERLRAIEALQHAEQRHLLAAKISRDIWLLPQIEQVPHEISRFLLGPWAQVMAQARLTDQSGCTDPGRYRELVDALIWSAQPELTRKNVGRLARLLPKLLTKLREGLASIDYPTTKTSAFFDLLMQLHQQAFKPAPENTPRPTKTTPTKSKPRPVPRTDDEPWIAPSEAKESGYIESTMAPESQSATTVPLEAANDGRVTGALESTAPSSPAGQDAMAIGTWVDLLVAGKWERTQLSWIGPHGTLFLFTSAYGRTQSMTQRLLDRLIEQGSMRVVTPQTVVEGALDAVAQAAMRNSVDVRL